MASSSSSLSLDCDEEYSEFCENFAFDFVSRLQKLSGSNFDCFDKMNLFYFYLFIFYIFLFRITIASSAMDFTAQAFENQSAESVILLYFTMRARLR